MIPFETIQLLLDIKRDDGRKNEVGECDLKDDEMVGGDASLFIELETTNQKHDGVEENSQYTGDNPEDEHRLHSHVLWNHLLALIV